MVSCHRGQTHRRIFHLYGTGRIRPSSFTKILLDCNHQLVFYCLVMMPIYSSLIILPLNTQFARHSIRIHRLCDVQARPADSKDILFRLSSCLGSLAFSSSCPCNWLCKLKCTRSKLGRPKAFSMSWLQRILMLTMPAPSIQTSHAQIFLRTGRHGKLCGQNPWTASDPTRGHL